MGSFVTCLGICRGSSCLHTKTQVKASFEMRTGIHRFAMGGQVDLQVDTRVVVWAPNYTLYLSRYLIKVSRNEIKTKCAGNFLIYAE